jgi:hypothetical protein
MLEIDRRNVYDVHSMDWGFGDEAWCLEGRWAMGLNSGFGVGVDVWV